ncbi:hypothetical protein AXG93_4888s1100 [Marchantia polymorpha subsp. ruderalis]|uniref:Uncharacterized protein n=1 Tax=Marchantia polymorpha subsp. ruderalis TaxID=1480154 RepID=A0A176VIW4_MARPO|nr:hypothetical protein AXG93_4888s1100 [Marchantia polymorpha subsp. ruderalis]
MPQASWNRGLWWDAMLRTEQPKLYRDLSLACAAEANIVLYCLLHRHIISCVPESTKDPRIPASAELLAGFGQGTYSDTPRSRQLHLEVLWRWSLHASPFKFVHVPPTEHNGPSTDWGAQDEQQALGELESIGSGASASVGGTAGFVH